MKCITTQEGLFGTTKEYVESGSEPASQRSYGQQALNSLAWAPASQPARAESQRKFPDVHFAPFCRRLLKASSVWEPVQSSKPARNLSEPKCKGGNTLWTNMQAGNSQTGAIGYRRANFLVSQPLNIIINSSKIDSHGRFIYKTSPWHPQPPP